MIRIAPTIILLTCLACSSKHPVTTTGDFLKTAVGTASQDDITQKLGPPYAAQSLSNGGSVWSYRYEDARFNQGSGRTLCREFVLTFDKDKVLRNYERKRC